MASALNLDFKTGSVKIERDSLLRYEKSISVTSAILSSTVFDLLWYMCVSVCAFVSLSQFVQPLALSFLLHDTIQVQSTGMPVSCVSKVASASSKQK